MAPSVETPVNTTGLLPEQVSALDRSLRGIANTGVAQQRNALMAQQLATNAAKNRAASNLAFTKNYYDRQYKLGKLSLEERIAKNQALLDIAKKRNLTAEADKLETEIAAMKTLKEQGNEASYGDKAIVDPRLVLDKESMKDPGYKAASQYLLKNVQTGALGGATGGTDVTQRQSAAILQRIPKGLSEGEAIKRASEAMLVYRTAQRKYSNIDDEDKKAQARKWIQTNLGYDPEISMIK